LKIFFLIFIIFFIFKNVYGLNIDDAIKGTIENNPKVKIAIEKINESKEIIIFSKGEKLPKVSSSISGTYSNADTTTTTSSTTPETFTDEYKVTITQNLYDSGVNDLEIKRSQILFDNELINFNITIQDLILDAINGYLTVINYEKSLEATKKNYDAVLKAYEETKTRFDLGSATLYDLQNAEASFATVETNLFAAKQNVIISKKSFQRIAGLNPINLEDVIDINMLVNIENVTQKALEDNLNLELILNNIKNIEILILKEKNSKKPSLDLSGTGLYSYGSRLDKGTETTSGTIALTLNIPLYDKGQDNSNIRKFQSQKLQSELELIDAKDDLQILVANTYKDFKINESRMKTNLSIIKSIETSLDSLRAEYQVGTKTITDLVEEEEKLLNANVNYLNSKKNYLLNYFKLKSLDGSLVALFNKYMPIVN
tara:strand:+ start:845 stop:2131 length:1287 start_codon:yes stop_codon:yes gene_type:complete